MRFSSKKKIVDNKTNFTNHLIKSISRKLQLVVQLCNLSIHDYS